MSNRIEPIAAGSKPSHRHALLGMLLVAMTLLAYAPAMTGGYIWDDDDYLTTNPHLVTLDGLAMLWVPGTTKQYYPMVFTTFWVEHHLWGLDPAGYHLVNVLLHAANALLVWRLALMLRIPGAWMIGAVFAVHPVHVESVAWITERKNVLSGLFYLLAAMSYLRFDEGSRQPGVPDTAKPERWRWYAGSMAAFVLALLSKSVTCSLPAALVLMMLWQGRRLSVRRLAPLLPFFIVGLALALNTARLERVNVGAVGDEFAFSVVQRILIASRALAFYPSKLLVPWPLVFIYPRWVIDARDVMAWLYVGIAAALGLASLVGWLRGRRGPMLALLFFAATIFPALGFFNVYPMRFSFVADHFQYLASLGIVALAVGTAATAIVAPRARAILCALVLTGLGILTWQRGRAYADEETLWTDTIQQNPAAFIAHNNLGKIQQERGDLDSAISHFEAAAALRPDDPLLRLNLAVALRAKARQADQQGRMDEAESLYRRSLAASVADRDTLILFGELLLRRGNADEAATMLRQFVAARPDDAFARMLLGDALAAAGNLDAAVIETRNALDLAQNQGLSQLAATITMRLEQYRQGTGVSR